MPTTDLTTKKFEFNGAELTVYTTRTKNPGPIYIWAHGWGRSYSDFRYFIEALANQGQHYLLDFPGFGASAEPPRPYDVADYALLTNAWLETLPKREKIWVCHSFGGRVGLHIAAKSPDLIQKLILIAAHGVKPIRKPLENFKIWCKVRCYKAAKILIKLGLVDKSIKSCFGSEDYKNTSETFRQTFIKVVNDDVTDLLPQIKQPALLIYASNDISTPPALGQRMAEGLSNSAYEQLDGFDHNTILTSGRHQVLNLIQTWLQTK
jgi:pimeloyl-ACP methyl ester carboxylesterase